MMKRRTAAGIASCLCLCLAQQTAHAWGDDGHEIVGLIASHYLDASVQAQVDALLAGDTTHLVPHTDMRTEATWADKYRDSDRPTGPHYTRTHNWHFVDLELNSPDLDVACNHHPALPAGTPASEGDANDCVADKITQFATELASPTTSTDERRMALQFLLHFLGDLHQPLHASDDHDSGGNAKKVTAPGVTATSLHSAWDTPFVKALGSDDATIANTLIARITAAHLAQWRQGTAADWAQESFQLARTEAYGKLPTPQADGSYALDSNYVHNAQTVVQQQLSRAGVRLALVLNQALGGQGGGTTTTPHELLGNPGFENGTAHPAPWTVTAGVISNDSSEPAHSGAFKAWLNGYGQTSTDTVQQSVTIPAPASGAGTGVTLSFWLHVDTEETTTSQRRDTLKVKVLDSAGRVKQTLATYSNLDAATGYTQRHVDLSAYAGQTITIQFTGTENASRRTSFVVDDVSVTAP